MSPIIMVTGGSRGIGAATALLAARRGFDVSFSYLHSPLQAAEIVESIRSVGRRAMAIKADVSCEEDVECWFEQTEAELGGPNALVNNAGILEQQQRVDCMTTERLVRTFSINVVGAFLCAKHAIRHMSTNHGGHGGSIVNVSSAASRLGSPGEYVDYAATKGAIDTFTIGLAREVAAEGIRVNAVRPAFIYTDIHAAGGEPGRVDRIKGSVPMRRGGQPEEVANAILWLISDEASYSTGALVDISGGA